MHVLDTSEIVIQTEVFVEANSDLFPFPVNADVAPVAPQPVIFN